MEKTAHAFSEENIEYLRKILGDYKVKAFLNVEETTENATFEDKEAHRLVKKYLEKMEEFGNNRWWISEDKKVLAYYQLMCQILLVPFDKFHKSLEFLLGRPVWIHERALNYEQLKLEAEIAFNSKES